MVERFVDIVRSNALELCIVGVVSFVILLIFGYAVAKASDHGIRMDENDRLR